MLVDELFSQAVEDIFGVFGVKATFIPQNGTPAGCRVIISDEVDNQPAGFDFAPIAQIKNIEARLAEIGQNPEAGDVFMVAEGDFAGASFTCGDELENDGRTVRIAIT